MISVSRRQGAKAPARWLGAAAVLVLPAGLTLAGCATNDSGGADKPYSGESIVVTSFGGDWEKSFVDAVVTPFEAETGANVELVTLYSADALAQITAQKDSPQIDVVHFSGGQEFTAARDGLIAPIDSADLSEYENLVDVAKAGMPRGEGPVIQMAPIGLVYNSESGAPAPKSWVDVFNAEYAGHVALTDFSNTYGVLSMLRVADALGDSTPERSQAIEELGDLAASGDAIVVSTSPDLQSAFAQRDIWVAPYAMDYAATLQDAGLPVEFIVPEEGATASLITSNVVAGGANTGLATLFVDYELRADAQQAFATDLRYSPVNQMTQLPPDVAERVLSADDLNTMTIYPPGDIDAGRASWTDQWNSLITK